MIFTDNEPPKSVIGVPNILFHKISFLEYCNRVSATLDIDYHPSRAYKLCDLKPFYGYIHQQELLGYDFWGFGDMDLVWGNIRNFYTDEILYKYDVLSTHADRLSGHFAVIRNNEHYIKLSFKHNKWKELLTNECNVAFDEHQFTSLLYPAARLLWKIRKLVFLRFRFDNDWLAYNKFCLRANSLLGLNRKRILFVERETTPWASGYQLEKKWKYCDGEINDLQDGEERIYLHFYAMKKIWTGDYYNPSERGAIIDFDGIHPLE